MLNPTLRAILKLFCRIQIQAAPNKFFWKAPIMELKLANFKKIQQRKRL